MTITNRFLKYIKFDTQSDESTNTTPSTSKQLIFARYLKEELEQLGLDDIWLDDKGYLFATLPSNVDRDIPTIGFISHMDTSPDMSGKDIQPRIVSNYDGKDIILSDSDHIILSPKRFPELLEHIGEDLIVTDGHTLLGADDKAGIAEIIEAMHYLKSHPEIKHGRIRIGFNPDEEIGMGAHHFDVEKFAADWAYTMDGGEVGELEFENFNAAAATVVITGTNVHPGSAKDKMVNSMLLANEFISALPSDETPSTTEGYEGFFHLLAIQGEVERTELHYIIRDHDRGKFEARKKLFEEIAKQMNKKHGEHLVTVTLHDQYYNMREKIEPQMHIIDIAFAAMTEAGVTPRVNAIRGGTDGAQLSFMGLPCPNIFAGGLNFHGRYEFVPIQSMEKAKDVIVKIAELTAKRY